MSDIRILWHNHRLVFLVFLAARAITLFFLVRLTVFSLYWADPAHRNQVPAPWMTPGYIAHSWGIEPRDLSAQLGVPQGQRPTLADIARERGVPVAQVLDEVNALLPDAPSQ